MKRLTFVCGSEPVLVEEVVDGTKSALGIVDYHSFNLESDKPEDFFNTLFQYQLTEEPRLIVARNTDRMDDWKPFYEWLEESYLSMPKTHVLLVSSASTLHLRAGGTWKLSPEGKKIVRDPAPALGARGRVVECKSLAGPELVKWTQRFAPQLNDKLAAYLISRVDGDLALVKAAATKLDLFRGNYLDEQAIAVLAEESVGDRFVDLLIRGKKYEATLAIPNIKIQDYTRIFAALDHMLDVLSILNTELRRFITKREQQQIVGVSPWHAEVYGKLSFSYDRYKVQRCRAALAYLEDAYASGDQHLLEEEDGVLEALVSLWL